MRQLFPSEPNGKLLIVIDHKEGFPLTAGSLFRLASEKTNVLSPGFLSTEQLVIAQPPLSEGAFQPMVIPVVVDEIRYGISGYEGTKHALKITGSLGSLIELKFTAYKMNEY